MPVGIFGEPIGTSSTEILLEPFEADNSEIGVEQEATSKAAEAKDDEFVTLVVVTEPDGQCRMSFQYLDQANQVESTGSKSSSASEPAKPITANPFARKSMPEEEVRRRISALSREWFSVSLGYFQVVPELTRNNREYVGAKLSSGVVDFARKVASSVEKTEDDDGSQIEEFRVTRNDFSVLLRQMGRSVHVPEAAKALARSSLGALVADYEAFMTNLLRTLARLHPKVFIPDDETVAVLSLEGFTSFDDFIEDLIDDKIQDLMQEKSHLQLLKWIEEKYKVNLSSNELMIREFVEIAQRRNIMAHAGGFVNKRYLKICTESGWKLSDLPKLGEQVVIDEKYLRRATARIFQVGFFTLHILWQKVLPKQREDSLNVVLTASHDFLDSDLTKMCNRLCKFALTSEKSMPAKTKTYFTINLAQSVLFDNSLGELERKREVEAILKQCDWSMVTPTVELALTCLRRDFSALDELTRKARASGLRYFEAMTWSIFREVRDRKEFIGHFAD